MLDKISDVFSSKLRLAIIAALLSGEKDFTTLKKITLATDGNLGKQMEILCNKGLVAARKEMLGKRNKTTYSITDNGVLSFRQYVEILENIIKDNGL